MKKGFWGFLFLIFIFSAQAKDKILYQWLELGPDNRLIVRAVTTDDQCPLLKTSHQKIMMDVHSKKNEAFPVTVCQAILPSQTTHASIQGQRISLPKKNPQTILIIGDTGCRMKEGVKVQDCDNPALWPFPAIAKEATKFKPDLVIHVGDYLYRESLGKPHGDNWLTWEADFFKPAKPLLKSSPWIFVRGNHETCERAGIGWTKILDPYSFKHCVNHSPLYSVMIDNNTRAFIVDSANANDFVAPSDQVDLYENYLRSISKSTTKYNWLIIHKPLWFIYDDDELNKAYQKHFSNTLQTAWTNVNPHDIDLLLSGHIHRFQSINFAKDRPPQIIVGSSGTSLDKNFERRDLKNLDVAGVPISQGLSVVQFSYMTLERHGDNWTAQLRDISGKELVTCDFHGKQFICHE